MKSIIKGFVNRVGGLDFLIELFTEQLAATVKNPASRRAATLRKSVTKLRDACDSFIEQTSPGSRTE